MRGREFERGSGLGWAHASMACDLAALVNVEAGLREVLIAEYHRGLAVRIGAFLDIDTGPTTNSAKAAPICSHVAVWLRVHSTTDRLRMRVHPAVLLVALMFKVAACRQLAGDGGPALDTALAAARALARHLDPDVARALEAASRGELDLAHAIGDAMAGARSLADSEVFSDLYLLAAGLNNLGLACDLNLAVAADLRLAVDLDRGIDLDRGLELDCDLDQARNDFAGVDLSRFDVVAGALEGLRWTRSTRWPPHMTEEIRNRSVELYDGVWEVCGGSQCDRVVV